MHTSQEPASIPLFAPHKVDLTEVIPDKVVVAAVSNGW